MKEKQYTAAFKAHVALKALKARSPIRDLAIYYNVHPDLVQAWRDELVAGADRIFSSGAGQPAHHGGRRRHE